MYAFTRKSRTTYFLSSTMIAMKFGGTSMGSDKNIACVADIVLNEAKKTKRQPIVVVSAMTGVTNMLLEASKVCMEPKGGDRMRAIIVELIKKHEDTAEYLIKKPALLKATKQYITDELKHLESFLDALGVIAEMTHTSHDRIVAIGEKLSARLLADHLADRGKGGVYVNLEFVNDEPYEFVDRSFFNDTEKKIKKTISKHLDKNLIPVCTGFFGKIPGGIIQAVGRGYSDFCAAIVGAAFNVAEIQIWTDVDGILSADPRIIKKAFVLDEISFNEASELSGFGAKVIHPQTVWPAVKMNIPVCIKNTMNPNFKGTMITKEGKMSDRICKAITSKKGIMVITLLSPLMEKHGYLYKVLKVFSDHKISVGVIATSEVSVSMTIDQASYTPKLYSDLRPHGNVSVLENQATVSVIGEEMGVRIGSGSKILASIAKQGLHASVISRGAMRDSITCVIDEDKAIEVVRNLHKDILEN